MIPEHQAPAHRPDVMADRIRSIRALPSGASKSVWQGLLGSALMMFGGFGVGWIAPGSALMRLPAVTELRTQPALTILCTLALVFGGLLMVRAWLRVGQRVQDFSRIHPWLLTKMVGIWSFPLLLTFPLFSRDVYAYVGQGRLMVAGLNPYTHGISALGNYFQLGSDLMWAEAPTPYGQVFLWIEQAVVWVTGGNLASSGSLEIAVLLFKLVAAAGVVLCAYFLGKIVLHFGREPSRALWLAIANPLFIMNFVASAHNDGLMLGLALAGIYFTLTKRPVLGVVLVTLSIAVKPITVISLPFIGLIWARNLIRARRVRTGVDVRPGLIWRTRVLCWLATAAIAVALLALMGVVSGTGFGWIRGLQSPGTVWIWYAPVGLVAVALGALVNLFAPWGSLVTNGIETVVKLVGVVAVLYLIFGARKFSLLTRMALAYAAVVLSSSVIQPWYVIWLVVFFVAAGLTQRWHVKLIYLLTVFLTVIALTDQLNVFQGIPFWIVRTTAILASVLFSLYIMFWDRKTKVLFDWHLRLRQRWTSWAAQRRQA